LSNLVEKKFYRWVLLKHIGSPDDSNGVHFDLLLEDKEFCKTWRLSNIPLLNGPYVESVCIAPHNLYWLDIKEKVLSGNRGVATRVKEGIFFEALSLIENRFLSLSVIWESLEVYLVIDENGCRITSPKK
tara:strand:- start:67 stop:456 length:390 start_codon:yes stop_codon:yes gene_type:complete